MEQAGIMVVAPDTEPWDMPEAAVVAQQIFVLVERHSPTAFWLPVVAEQGAAGVLQVRVAAEPEAAQQVEVEVCAQDTRLVPEAPKVQVEA
jgi:hypothetical protein